MSSSSTRAPGFGMGVLIMLMAAMAFSQGDLGLTSRHSSPRAEGLLIARCSVCHGVDLITQQRLPRERWEATVEKMNHWGAEISAEEANVLVGYLSNRYHPFAPDHLPLLEQSTPEPSTLDAEVPGRPIGVSSRGAGLFGCNCQACHGAGATGGIGPQLSKNPILTNEELFWETVLYGRGPMPAWGTVLTSQEISDIHEWLLTR